MKNNGSIFKIALFSIASMFVLASDLVAYSGSVLFWGEPKCPKNLLK
ncbi:cyclic lactone autoinducer peptide [Anaerovirgula multivorans]|uniref:Cyclic lactone autoinducer peptide n=1 Tax=Anaerovirgula multivorans TaxID=312168 RepID=A0A239LHT0_9FIRM|nr:cyclic lactone autoinducer peptide [Anaerovirgula multivorans]SNT29393.1 cyclic lactone autoinducer peptide [Anaerovirgula multivorans]